MKTSYKRAHTKARIKAQSTEGSEKFVTVNAVRQVLDNREVTTGNGSDEVGIKALEGYFDNLAASTANKKSVLEKLVVNNAKLSATNEDLVAIVKKYSTRIRISNERSTASRKWAAVGQHKGSDTQRCAPIAKSKFIYFRFTMLGLADGPTPSRLDFPTRRAIILILC